MTRARRAALLIALVVAAAWPAPARAYVRYRNLVTGELFFWQKSCVAVTVYLNGYSEMSANDVAKSVAAAAHTWSPDAVTCGSGASATHPYLEIVPSLSLSTGVPPPAAFDSKNSVIFRTELWQMSGKSSGKVYNTFALAITSVFAKPDGHIVDADIEINVVPDDGFGGGKHFQNFDDPTANVGGNFSEVYDLQNTLTHEFGHFIGLDHSCYTFDPNDPARERPKDDMENEVPDCDSAPDAVRKTVMFDSTSVREVSKRVLSSDEVRAACMVYPEDSDPKICPLDVPNDGLGCAIPADRPAGRGRGFGGAAGLAAAAAAVLIATAARWRGRRRARPRS